MLIKLQLLIIVWYVEIWWSNMVCEMVTINDFDFESLLKQQNSEVITGPQASVNQLHKIKPKLKPKLKLKLKTKPISATIKVNRQTGSTATSNNNFSGSGSGSGSDSATDTFTTINQQYQQQQQQQQQPHTIKLPSSGYIYPDNDEVIHIIEPPRQFQEMKKFMQKPNPNHHWKLQQQISRIPAKINMPGTLVLKPAPGPPSLPSPPSSPPQLSAAIVKRKTNTKHLNVAGAGIGAATSVAVPAVINHGGDSKTRDAEILEMFAGAMNNKQKTYHKTNNKNINNSKYNKPRNYAFDMFGEESQVLQRQYQQQQQQQQLQPQQQGLSAVPAHPAHLAHPAFPLEILTSVRKTKRYFLKNKPQVPKAKQRLRSKKIQTVIYETGHENGQLEKGKQQKVQGIRENYVHIAPQTNHIVKRMKRDLRDVVQQQQHQLYRGQQIVQASSSSLTPTSLSPLLSQTYINEANVVNEKPLKGESLLNHLNDLLKEATNILNPIPLNNMTNEEHETSTLIGELLPLKEKKSDKHLTGLSDDTVSEILENSFKATNALINHLKIRAKVNDDKSAKLCQLNNKYNNGNSNNVETMTIHKTHKDMRQHFDCVKNQMHKLNITKLQPITKQIQFTAKFTKNPLAKAKLANGFATNEVTNTNGNFHSNNNESINGTLIYDDVMTAIRTMLHGGNNLTGANATLIDDDSDLMQDENIQQLNQYINSLQNLIAHIPHYIHINNRLKKQTNKKLLSASIGRNIMASGSSPIAIGIKRNVKAPLLRRTYRHYPVLVMHAEYLKNDTNLDKTFNSYSNMF